MEVEEFLKEAAVMKEIKHPNLVQLLGKDSFQTHGSAEVHPIIKAWMRRTRIQMKVQNIQ